MVWKRKYRSYKKKSRRGKYARRKSRKFAQRVKKAVLKVAETKYRIFAEEWVDLYHDRGAANAGALASTQGSLIFNPWFNYVTKGTSVGNRIGDEIYPRGISLRMCYWCAADRQAQFLRFIVVSLPRVNTYPGGPGEIVTTAGSVDLMDPAGSNDTVTGMIKSSDTGIKVLFDKLYTLRVVGKTEDADQIGEQRWFKKFWIKAKKGSKLTWGIDGYLKNNPMAIYVIPYDDYNTLRTDILGKISYTCKLYWKDP